VSIDFDLDRWAKVKETHRRWWAGELDRPVIYCTAGGRDPGRDEPQLPAGKFTAMYDLSVSVDAIVDKWDYELSRMRFLGDSYPRVWPNFGPGVMAAFLGARYDVAPLTVWFHSPRNIDITELHFEYDPDNVWLRRIKDICRSAVARWDGLVQVGMTDLGGNLDCLSTFLPGEKLLLELYDHPDDIRRLIWEIHELWHRFYGEINEILQPTNPGYCAWAGIYSERPSYMLQCDFAYMISPQMFNDFVRPELVATCKRLEHSMYHLDGAGQLPHLDSLLSIEELDGVQWVPGTGKPRGNHWLDVYCKILNAGKRAQLFQEWVPDLSLIDVIAEKTACPGGILLWCDKPDEEVLALMKKYGAS